tara:strand:+ start:2030 stop:2689 length:660 start_codon:yes stop_codon:yes gene_type:complete
MREILLLILAVSIIFSGSVYAQSTPYIELILSTSSYNYGDKLDYRIIVSEVTGEDAVIFITDTFGNKSQLLTIPIYEKESRIIAPFAFDSVIWMKGTYELELHYSNSTSSSEFTIRGGTIGIPYWIKDLSKLWTSGQMADKEFGKSIQFLINEKIIFNPKPGEMLIIPEWFKITTLWWSNNQIPDTIYGNSLQFLIDERIITIPIDQKSFSQESSDKTL